VEAVEDKHGKARRVWVFDRGIVSEENLKWLRDRGAHYLVGTPRRSSRAYEQQLLEGSWRKISEQVQVQLVGQEEECTCCAAAFGAKRRRRRCAGVWCWD